MTIKFRELSKTIADKEAGAVEVNIAQINEILRVTLKTLASHTALDVLKLLEKYKD